MKVDEDFSRNEDPIFEVKYLGKNGEEVSEVKDAFAKTSKEADKPINQYILVNRSEPVNPNGLYRNPEFKFRRVGSVCYDSYVDYLRTKEDRFLRFARRYIDG